MKVQSKSDNKKIGELVCDGAMKFVQNFAVEINGERVAEYKGLDAVAKDWEDYTPTEPLIKDEKIRKAVRAWADVNGDTKLYYNRPTIEICINNKAGYVIRSIKFKAEFRKAIDIESGYYTITELCGEEEE